MGLRTKIKGVAYNNPDGKSRQDILMWMKDHGYGKGDMVYFEREPDNPVDPNAVKVLNDRHQCLGYLTAGIAESIAEMIDDGLGKHLYGEILNITGGTDSRPTLGCNIEIPMVGYTDNEPGDDSSKKYNVRKHQDKETNPMVVFLGLMVMMGCALFLSSLFRGC